MTPRPKTAKSRANFYLTDNQLAQIKKLSKETGLSYSELLRRAIDEYLERQKSKKEGGEQSAKWRRPK